MTSLINAALVAAAALAAGTAGCKKKSSETEEPTAVDDGSTGDPTPSDSTPAARSDPDPDFEPIPDTPADAAPPAAAAALTEAGVVLFDATSGAVTPGGWTVDATELRFDITPIGTSDATADVQVTMSSGGRSTQVHTCRGLSRTGEGDVTARTSGDDVVFITCFSRADSSGAGSSNGVRIRWNKDRRIAEVVNRYQSEGRADPDTMDFDESP